MCDFAPGDEVEALDNDGGEIGRIYDLWLDLFCPGVPDTNIPDGTRFIVRDVVPHPDIDGLFGVNVDGEGLYPHFIFRKVRRRDLTVWLSTENTIEEPKRAPAKERV